MTEDDEIEILYLGRDEVSVPLRGGRVALFSLQEPQKVLPRADALDLLSPPINGGRFVRIGGAS